MKRLTKKQQADRAEYEADRERQWDAFAAFRDRFHGKEFEGTIRWFDAASGEGIAVIEGHSFHLHFSAIETVNKNGYAYPTNADQVRLSTLGYHTPCKLTPYVTYGMVCIERCVIDEF